MKIAVASDNRKTISHHFGSANGFEIFEIKDKKIINKEYRKNLGKSTGECGSCNHETMLNNIKDCDIVISYGMGKRIYDDLIRYKIKAIVTNEETIDSAIKKFLKNDLDNRIDKLH